MKCKTVCKKIAKPASALCPFIEKTSEKQAGSRSTNTDSVKAKLGTFKLTDWGLANYYTPLQTETVNLNNEPQADSQCHFVWVTNIQRSKSVSGERGESSPGLSGVCLCLYVYLWSNLGSYVLQDCAATCSCRYEQRPGAAEESNRQGGKSHTITIKVSTNRDKFLNLWVVLFKLYIE